MSNPFARACSIVIATAVAAFVGIGIVWAEDIQHSSYLPVDIKETFQSIYTRMTSQKPAIEAAHQAVLDERYDLSNHPSSATMSKGKPIQEGVRVKLPA